MDVKILVVDDDPIVAYLHKKMIQKYSPSSEPVICLGGREAISILESEIKSNQSYLILLDINMPEMNGWEFLETLIEQKLTNNVSVIIISSSVNMADRQKAETYKQVTGYVEKPLTMNMFADLNVLFSGILGKRNS